LDWVGSAARRREGQAEDPAELPSVVEPKLTARPAPSRKHIALAGQQIPEELDALYCNSDR